MARGASAGRKQPARKKRASRKQAAKSAETTDKALGEGAAPEAAAKRGRGRPRIERPTNGPTPDQQAETLAELIRLDTESAELGQAKATVLNRFEKWGGNKKQIKATKALLMLDAREAQVNVETLLHYAANAGIEVRWQADGQSTLVDSLEPAKPKKTTSGTRDLAAAKAHSDGFNSGKAGSVPHDNPFTPGSEEYVSWHDGRDDGQRAREGKTPGLSDRIAESKTADASMPTTAASEAPAPF